MSQGSSRTYTSSIWRWSKEAPGKGGEPCRQALADLERRKALGPREDLTGRLLGDPPPGRSALDRKLEAQRRRVEAIEATKQATEENGNG